MFEVKGRDVPEQLVLTEQRHVHIDNMPGWLPGAMQRMTQQADARGGSAGPMFVIYHGEVTHDSDGPVEVCVPVGGALESIAELATRREPAHREVYVRITKAQWEFPQILSAYDAVCQFIHTNGLTATSAPRRKSSVDAFREQIAEWLKQGLSGVRMMELAREDPDHPYAGGRSVWPAAVRRERLSLLHEQARHRCADSL
jgi:hypothetical protein